MEAFLGFLTNIKDANFGFGVIFEAIVKLYYSITENPDMKEIWDGAINFIGEHFALVCTLLALFCVTVAFLGQKMMGFLRFVALFVVGFVLSVHFLAPLIPEQINIPAWVVGLVVAIVVGVLSRFIYYAVYAIVGGYSVYILCYHGFYITAFDFFTKGNAILSLLVALVIVVLAFVFKKYVEMALTAALGGWFSAVLIGTYVYNFAAWPIFGGIWWVAFMSVGLVVAIPGYIVQFITRPRY